MSSDSEITTLSEYADIFNECEARTEPMKVKSLAPLVSRMARDAHPDQFLRELVQNSIEARATTIKISPSWRLVEELGLYFFSIADDGVGMNPDEIKEYYNMFSSSGKGEVSVNSENFGIGAKVTCLSWNPAGIIIMSWKDGEGSMATLWIDPEGKPGLKWISDGEGYESVWAAPEEFKEPFIKDHGTIVILLGKEGKQNTYYGPENCGRSTYSHLQDLNMRYLKAPDKCRITVDALSSKNEWPKNEAEMVRRGNKKWKGSRHIVHGAAYYLDRMTKHSGVVESSEGFKIHWRILDEGRHSRSRVAFPNHAFSGAVYNNEIYDRAKGIMATNHFKNFGIYRSSVRRNIVILVEPEDCYKPNNIRTKLIHETILGKELPWEKYYQFFRDNMPKEITEALEMCDQDLNQSLNDQIDKYLLKMLKGRMKRKSLRQKTDGESSASLGDGIFDLSGVGSGIYGGGENSGQKQTRVVRRRSTRQKQPQRSQPGYEGETQKVTNRNKKIVPPSKYWVHEEDEDGLKGYAAKYDEISHKLFINVDFEGLKELLVSYMNEDEDIIVTESVQQAWAESLCFKIMNAYNFKNTEVWDGNKWKEAVSSHSLTVAMANGIELEPRINRLLGFRRKSLTKV